MGSKILYMIGVLAVATGLFFVLLKNNVSFSPNVETTTPATEETEDGYGNQIVPELPGIALPLSTAPGDVAWDLFQKYLNFNKTRNLEGVRSVVYKVASVCEDPKTRLDCEGRMGLAYNYGKDLEKRDYVNIWSDDNQIILSTDFKMEEDESIIGRTRSMLFFVKDNGALKLLSFSPIKGATISKGEASREELLARINIYTKDSDNDGIADYDEECLSASGTACEKTDPKIRDTDGDGWWDGIEVYRK